jgi:dipeptidyl aminopeptidase/acylaminoacyl peptidase
MRLKGILASIVFVACLGSWSGWLTAEPPSMRSTILGVEPVVFPRYDSYKGIARYAHGPDDYARAIADRRFVMERLEYRSDDLEVYAYLYRPAKPPRDAKLPVVIFNRGSYVRNDFSPEVLMLGRRLAARDFLVIAPMLRGSGGANGHDEMGGADLHDLLNIIPVLKELPYADPERVFLYGESRGGIMCLLAAKHNLPARAMAIYGAITDLGSFIGEGRPARALAPSIWPGFPANEAGVVEARSALRWPERIGIPVLIMNGGDDGEVSPLHALRLALALEDLHKPYELKIFYGETHVLPGRAVERDEDAMRWFRRFDTQPSKTN